MCPRTRRSPAPVADPGSDLRWGRRSGVQRLPPVRRIGRRRRSAASAAAAAGRPAAPPVGASYREPSRRRPRARHHQDAGRGQQQAAEQHRARAERMQPGRADRVGRPGQVIDQRRPAADRTSIAERTATATPRQHDHHAHHPPQHAAGGQRGAEAGQRRPARAGPVRARGRPGRGRSSAARSADRRSPPTTRSAPAASAASPAPASARTATGRARDAAGQPCRSRGAGLGHRRRRPPAGTVTDRPQGGGRADRGDHRGRLALAFRVLGGRHRVGHDAGAGLDVARCRRRPARCGW